MVNVAVPPDTMLPDAPYWIDQQGDTWMGLPDGSFVMVGYQTGRVRWIGTEPATLSGMKLAGIRLGQPITYTQAMVTILLKVISRFEGAMRSANLI